MRQIMDGDYGVNELSKICLKAAEDKGFLKPDFPEMMVLLHTEISEAFEEYRNHKKPTEIYYSDPFSNANTTPKPEGIPIELADLAIRLFHYCGYLGIDLAAAVEEKMAYNKTRAFRHGNKKA